MADRNRPFSIEDLPSHLILEILTSGKRLTAADLVSLELTSRTFGGNHGVYPTKFRSLVDLAAFQLCTTNGIYIGMSCSNQREAILCGVLGHGPETTQCVAFTRINFPSPANVIQMSASQNHAAFVLQSGEEGIRSSMSKFSMFLGLKDTLGELPSREASQFRSQD
ncbi:hypothetical protein V6N11_035116 [Hibiscus sabdariffa]|uniref:F-box domain-containing protein n=1 Tax=Hibiscus sabdariffa TaxID=183260 RepID=A0ABR2R046_9ROSI